MSPDDTPSRKLDAAKQPATTTREIKQPFLGIITADYLSAVLDVFDKKFENIDKKFENIDKKFSELDLKFILVALVPAGIMFGIEALKTYRIIAESQAFAQKADLVLEITKRVL